MALGEVAAAPASSPQSRTGTARQVDHQGERPDRGLAAAVEERPDDQQADPERGSGAEADDRLAEARSSPAASAIIPIWAKRTAP